MTGYEYIKNMTDMKISESFGVSHDEAVNIRNCSIEQMIKHLDVCKEDLGITGNCRKKPTSCNKCRKEFLEDDISM